jgi:hypothetical protein
MEGTIEAGAAALSAGGLGAKSGIEEGLLGVPRLHVGGQCGGQRDKSYEGKTHVAPPCCALGGPMMPLSDHERNVAA